VSIYQVSDPETEIVGTIVSAFTKSLLHEDIAGILQRHQLDNIDPNEWYRVQRLLDVFNEVVSEGNTSSVFVSLGMAAAQVALDNMPPALKTLPMNLFFANYDAVWQSRHRNGDVGHVKFEQVDENHIKMSFNSPYPNDIFYGAFYTYARHYCPPNKRFTVAYERIIPILEERGQEAIIHIRLENQ
jgi:hypothetical protein